MFETAAGNPGRCLGRVKGHDKSRSLLKTVSSSDSPGSCANSHKPKPHSRPTDQISGGLFSVGPTGGDSDPSWGQTNRERSSGQAGEGESRNRKLSCGGGEEAIDIFQEESTGFKVFLDEG